MTELREAAERLREHLRLELASKGELVMPYAGIQRDLNSLAFAYLAEHAADDDEPIDEAWLAARGERIDDGVFVFEHRASPFQIFVWTNDGDSEGSPMEFNLGDPDQRAPIRTRGQLRDLCQALSVPLKEPRAGE